MSINFMCCSHISLSQTEIKRQQLLYRYLKPQLKLYSMQEHQRLLFFLKNSFLHRLKDWESEDSCCFIFMIDACFSIHCSYIH